MIRPGILHIRASRPVYRRAGLVFAGRAWTDVTPADVPLARMLELLRDPVLVFEMTDTDGNRLRLTPADLSMARIALEEHLDEEARLAADDAAAAATAEPAADPALAPPPAPEPVASPPAAEPPAAAPEPAAPVAEPVPAKPPRSPRKPKP